MSSPADAEAIRYAPMLVEAGGLHEAGPALAGAARADICIVGGGYLGLWTAIGLLEANENLRVAIIEADVCGGGASGRNSGMVLSWWSKFETLMQLCGKEEALRLCREAEGAIDDIAAFCDSHLLDIEFRRTGWLWGAISPKQEGRSHSIVEALAKCALEPFRPVDRQAIFAMVDAPGYISGVYDATAATIQPGKLARGLRRIALGKGAVIYEHSPMRRLERGVRPAVVTPGGRIQADKIILALNAWSLALPELRSGIFVITSDDFISAPAGDFLDRHRWRDGPILTDSAVFVSGYRPTADGRIVAGVTGGDIGFGGLKNARFEGTSPREADIARALHIGFRDSSPPAIVASWRGPIDRTRDGTPVFGQLPGAPSVYFGYGFSGNGIVGCRIGARILTSLALEQRDAWTESGLIRRPERWMPPEPFRYVGAHAVRWAVRRKDRLERDGGAPDFFSSRLAALAPGGIVTTRSAKRRRAT